jgi:hypothetical protein
VNGIDAGSNRPRLTVRKRQLFLPRCSTICGTQRHERRALRAQAPSRMLDLEVPAALEGTMDHAELQAQITAARQFLASLDRARFEGRDDQRITFRSAAIRRLRSARNVGISVLSSAERKDCGQRHLG